MCKFDYEIRVESYIAKVITFNVMNNFAKTKEAVELYHKACKQHKTGRIVLETANEIKLWHEMLRTYQPKSTEQKVYNAMLNKAKSGVEAVCDYECLQWEMFVD